MNQTRFHSKIYQSATTKTRIKLKSSPFNSKIRIFALAQSPADIVKGIQPKIYNRQFRSKQNQIVEDISTISTTFSHIHNDVEVLLDKNTEEAKDAEIQDSELFKALLPLSEKFSHSQFFNDKIKKEEMEISPSQSSDDLFAHRRHHRKYPAYRYHGRFVSPKPRHFSPNARYKSSIPKKVNTARIRRNSLTIRNSLPVISITIENRSYSFNNFNKKRLRSPQSHKSHQLDENNTNNKDVSKLDQIDPKEIPSQNYQDKNSMKNNRKVSFDKDSSEKPGKSSGHSKKQITKSKIGQSKSDTSEIQKRQNSPDSKDAKSIKKNNSDGQLKNRQNSPTKENELSPFRSPKVISPNKFFRPDKQSKQISKEIDLDDANKDKIDAKENQPDNKNEQNKDDESKLNDENEQNNNDESKIDGKNNQNNNGESKDELNNNNESKIDDKNESNNNDENKNELNKDGKSQNELNNNDENQNELNKDGKSKIDDKNKLNRDGESKNGLSNNDESKIDDKNELNKDGEGQNGLNNNGESKIDDKNELNKDGQSKNEINGNDENKIDDIDGLNNNDKNKLNNNENDNDNGDNENKISDEKGIDGQKEKELADIENSTEFNDSCFLENDPFSTLFVYTPYSNFQIIESSLLKQNEENQEKEDLSNSDKPEDETATPFLFDDISLLNTDFNSIGFVSDFKETANKFNADTFNTNSQNVAFIKSICKNKKDSNEKEDNKEASNIDEQEEMENINKELQVDDNEKIVGNGYKPDSFNLIGYDLLSFSSIPKYDDDYDVFAKGKIKNEFVIPQQADKNCKKLGNSLLEIDNNQQEMKTIPTYFNALKQDDFANFIDDINQIGEDEENVSNGQNNFAFKDRSANLLFGNSMQVFGLTNDFGDSNETNVNVISSLDENGTPSSLSESYKERRFEYTIPTMNDSMFFPLTFVNIIKSMIAEEKESLSSVNLLADDLILKDVFQVSSDEKLKFTDDFNLNEATSHFVNKLTSFIINFNYQIQTQNRTFIDLIIAASKYFVKNLNDFVCKHESSKAIDNSVKDDFKTELLSKYVDQINDFFIKSSSKTIKSRDFKTKSSKYVDFKNDFKTQKSAQIIKTDQFSDNFACKISPKQIKANEQDFNIQHSIEFVDSLFKNDFKTQESNQIIKNDRFNENFTCKSSSKLIESEKQSFKIQDDVKFIDSNLIDDFKTPKSCQIIEQDKFNNDLKCPTTSKTDNNKSNFELQIPSRITVDTINSDNFVVQKSVTKIEDDKLNNNFKCEKLMEQNETETDFECQQATETLEEESMLVFNNDESKIDYKLKDELMTVSADKEINNLNDSKFTIEAENETNKPSDYLTTETIQSETEKMTPFIIESNEDISSINKNIDNTFNDLTSFCVINNDDYQYNQFNSIYERELDRFLPTMNDKCFQSISFSITSIPYSDQKQVVEVNEVNNKSIQNDEDEFNLRSIEAENKVENDKDFILDQEIKQDLSMQNKETFTVKQTKLIDQTNNLMNEFNILNKKPYKLSNNDFTIKDSIFDSSKFNDMKLTNTCNYRDESYLLNDNFNINSWSNPIVNEESLFISEINNDSFKNQTKKDEFLNESKITIKSSKFDSTDGISYQLNKDNKNDFEITDTECYKVESSEKSSSIMMMNYVDNQSFGEFLTVQSNNLSVSSALQIKNDFNNNDYSMPPTSYDIICMDENELEGQNQFSLPNKDSKFVSEIPATKSPISKEIPKIPKSSFSSIDVSLSNSSRPKKNEFNDDNSSSKNKNKLIHKSPTIKKFNYKDDSYLLPLYVHHFKYKDSISPSFTLESNYKDSVDLTIDNTDNYINNYNDDEMSLVIDNNYQSYVNKPSFACELPTTLTEFNHRDFEPQNEDDFTDAEFDDQNAFNERNVDFTINGKDINRFSSFSTKQHIISDKQFGQLRFEYKLPSSSFANQTISPFEKDEIEVVERSISDPNGKKGAISTNDFNIENINIFNNDKDVPNLEFSLDPDEFRSVSIFDLQTERSDSLMRDNNQSPMVSTMFNNKKCFGYNQFENNEFNLLLYISRPEPSKYNYKSEDESRMPNHDQPICDENESNLNVIPQTSSTFDKFLSSSDSKTPYLQQPVCDQSYFGSEDPNSKRSINDSSSFDSKLLNTPQSIRHQPPLISSIQNSRQKIDDQLSFDSEVPYAKRSVDGQPIFDSKVSNREQSVRDQPSFDSQNPMSTRPINDQSSFDSNIRDQTIRDQSSFDSNVRGQTIRDQSSFDSNVRDQTIRDQSSFDSNVRGQTIRDQSSFNSNEPERSNRNKSSSDSKTPKQGRSINKQSSFESNSRQPTCDQSSFDSSDNALAKPESPDDYKSSLDSKMPKSSKKISSQSSFKSKQPESTRSTVDKYKSSSSDKKVPSSAQSTIEQSSFNSKSSSSTKPTQNKYQSSSSTNMPKSEQLISDQSSFEAKSSPVSVRSSTDKYQTSSGSKVSTSTQQARDQQKSSFSSKLQTPTKSSSSDKYQTRSSSKMPKSDQLISDQSSFEAKSSPASVRSTTDKYQSKSPNPESSAKMSTSSKNVVDQPSFDSKTQTPTKSTTNDKYQSKSSSKMPKSSQLISDQSSFDTQIKSPKNIATQDKYQSKSGSKNPEYSQIARDKQQSSFSSNSQTPTKSTTNDKYQPRSSSKMPKSDQLVSNQSSFDSKLQTPIKSSTKDKYQTRSSSKVPESSSQLVSEQSSFDSVLQTPMKSTTTDKYHTKSSSKMPKSPWFVSNQTSYDSVLQTPTKSSTNDKYQTRSSSKTPKSQQNISEEASFDSVLQTPMKSTTNDKYQPRSSSKMPNSAQLVSNQTSYDSMLQTPRKSSTNDKYQPKSSSKTPKSQQNISEEPSFDSVLQTPMKSTTTDNYQTRSSSKMPKSPQYVSNQTSYDSMLQTPRKSSTNDKYQPRSSSKTPKSQQSISEETSFDSVLRTPMKSTTTDNYQTRSSSKMPTSSQLLCTGSSFASILKTPTKSVNDRYQAFSESRIATYSRLTNNQPSFTPTRPTYVRGLSSLLSSQIALSSRPTRDSIQIHMKVSDDNSNFLLNSPQYSQKSNPFLVPNSLFVDRPTVHAIGIESSLFQEHFVCSPQKYSQKGKNHAPSRLQRRYSKNSMNMSMGNTNFTDIDLMTGMNSFQSGNPFSTERGIGLNKNEDDYEEEEERFDQDGNPLPIDEKYRLEREIRRFQTNLPSMNDYSMPSLTFISPQCQFNSEQKEEKSNAIDEENKKICYEYDSLIPQMNDSMFETFSFLSKQSPKTSSNISQSFDEQKQKLKNYKVLQIIDDILIYGNEFNVFNISQPEKENTFTCDENETNIMHSHNHLIDENNEKPEYFIETNNNEFDSTKFCIDPSLLKVLPSVTSLSKQERIKSSVILSAKDDNNNKSNEMITNQPFSSCMICKNVFLFDDQSNDENDDNNQQKSNGFDPFDSSSIMNSIERGMMLTDKAFGELKFECPAFELESKPTSYNDEEKEPKLSPTEDEIVSKNELSSINECNDKNEHLISTQKLCENQFTKMILPHDVFIELPSFLSNDETESQNQERTSLVSKGIFNFGLPKMNLDSMTSLFDNDESNKKKNQFIEEVFDESEFLVYPLSDKSTVTLSYFLPSQSPQLILDSRIHKSPFLSLSKARIEQQDRFKVLIKLETPQKDRFEAFSNQSSPQKDKFKDFGQQKISQKDRFEDFGKQNFKDKSSDANENEISDYKSSLSSFKSSPSQGKVSLTEKITDENNEAETDSLNNMKINSENQLVAPGEDKLTVVPANKAQNISLIHFHSLIPLYQDLNQSKIMNIVLRDENVPNNNNYFLDNKSEFTILRDLLSQPKSIIESDANKTSFISNSIISSIDNAKLPESDSKISSIDNAKLPESESKISSIDNAKLPESDSKLSTTNNIILPEIDYNISSLNQDANMSNNNEVVVFRDKLPFERISTSNYSCLSNPAIDNFNFNFSYQPSNTFSFNSTFENNFSKIEANESMIKDKSLSNDFPVSQEFITISAIFPEKSSNEDIFNQSFDLLNSSADFILYQQRRMQNKESPGQNKSAQNASSLLVANSNYNVSLPNSPVYSQFNEFMPPVIKLELARGYKRRRDPGYEKFDVTIFGKNHAFISYVNDSKAKDDDENKNGTTKIDSSFLNMPAQPIKGPIPKIGIPKQIQRDLSSSSQQTDNEDNDESKPNIDEKEDKFKQNTNKDESFKTVNQIFIEEEEEEEEELSDNQKDQQSKEQENEKKENEYNKEIEDKNQDISIDKIGLLSEGTDSYASPEKQKNSDLKNSIDSNEDKRNQNQNKEEDESKSFLTIPILSQSSSECNSPTKELDQVESKENENEQAEIKDTNKDLTKEEDTNKELNKVDNKAEEETEDIKQEENIENKENIDKDESIQKEADEKQKETEEIKPKEEENMENKENIDQDESMQKESDEKQKETEEISKSKEAENIKQEEELLQKETDELNKEIENDKPEEEEENQEYEKQKELEETENAKQEEAEENLDQKEINDSLPKETENIKQNEAEDSKKEDLIQKVVDDNQKEIENVNQEVEEEKQGEDSTQKEAEEKQQENTNPEEKEELKPDELNPKENEELKSDELVQKEEQKEKNEEIIEKQKDNSKPDELNPKENEDLKSDDELVQKEEQKEKNEEITENQEDNSNQDELKSNETEEEVQKEDKKENQDEIIEKPKDEQENTNIKEEEKENQEETTEKQKEEQLNENKKESEKASQEEIELQKDNQVDETPKETEEKQQQQIEDKKTQQNEKELDKEKEAISQKSTAQIQNQNKEDESPVQPNDKLIKQTPDQKSQEKESVKPESEEKEQLQNDESPEKIGNKEADKEEEKQNQNIPKESDQIQTSPQKPEDVESQIEGNQEDDKENQDQVPKEETHKRKVKRRRKLPKNQNEKLADNENEAEYDKQKDQKEDLQSKAALEKQNDQTEPENQNKIEDENEKDNNKSKDEKENQNQTLNEKEKEKEKDDNVKDENDIQAERINQIINDNKGLENENPDQAKKNEHRRKKKKKTGERRLKDSLNLYFGQEDFDKENEYNNDEQEELEKENQIEDFIPYEPKNTDSKTRKRRRVRKHPKGEAADQQENENENQNEDQFKQPNENDQQQEQQILDEKQNEDQSEKASPTKRRTKRVHSPSSALKDSQAINDEDNDNENDNQNKDQNEKASPTKRRTKRVHSPSSALKDSQTINDEDNDNQNKDQNEKTSPTKRRTKRVHSPSSTLKDSQTINGEDIGNEDDNQNEDQNEKANPTKRRTKRVHSPSSALKDSQAINDVDNDNENDDQNKDQNEKANPTKRRTKRVHSPSSAHKNSQINNENEEKEEEKSESVKDDNNEEHKIRRKKKVVRKRNKSPDIFNFDDNINDKENTQENPEENVTDNNNNDNDNKDDNKDDNKPKKKKKIVRRRVKDSNIFMFDRDDNENNDENDNDNENEPDENEISKQRYQDVISNLENTLPNYQINDISNKNNSMNNSRNLTLNLELSRNINDDFQPVDKHSKTLSPQKPATTQNNNNNNSSNNKSIILSHIEVPTVHHTKPAPPLPLPKISEENQNQNLEQEVIEEEEEEDKDHNIISVVLKPKTVKFSSQISKKKKMMMNENEQNWPNLSKDYYQRNNKTKTKGGNKNRNKNKVVKKNDIEPESNAESLHNFIMSPLQNLQQMTPNRSEKFMRQLSTNEFDIDEKSEKVQSHEIDFTVFFESIIFPISIKNDEISNLIKSNMTFDECLTLSANFIDDILVPLKSDSIVFKQTIDNKTKNYFEITLNGLISTKNSESTPVPINEATYKVVNRRGKKTSSIRVNFGNESILLNTKESEKLIPLLDHESFGVISVLNEKENAYNKMNRDIFGVLRNRVEIDNEYEDETYSNLIRNDVIISPNLYVSLVLLNSSRFPLKLVRKLFDSMIHCKYHIYLTRALFLAEAATVPSHLIFKRSSKYSRPLMLIFIAYGIKWIRNLIASLVKVKEIEIQRFVKLILKSLQKLPDESFFIIRTIITLSFFTVGNGKSVFFVFLSFISRVIREVVKVTKNEEEIDYNGEFLSNEQIIEAIQALFSNLLNQLEKMDKDSDSSFDILIPFLSAILNKTPVLNEKEKELDLMDVKKFIQNNKGEIEYELMKFVDQPKNKHILAYSFAFNFQFLSELTD